MITFFADIDLTWALSKILSFFFLLYFIFSSNIHRKILKLPVSRLNLPSLFFAQKGDISSDIWAIICHCTSHAKTRIEPEKKDGGWWASRASLPCNALFSKAAHEAYAPRARRVISVPTPSFLCLPLSLSLLPFPSWRCPPISSASRPSSCDCAGVSRVSLLPFCRPPFSPLSVMSCPVLASSSMSRHNLPQTLKKSGLLLENLTFDARETICHV